jgi:hypothetical protein
MQRMRRRGEGDRLPLLPVLREKGQEKEGFGGVIMAHVNGRLTTCDRCGAMVFSKSTGEGETDGGYTRWNKFEQLPAGWKNTYDAGMLCPDCSAKYREMIKKFLQNKNDGM